MKKLILALFLLTVSVLNSGMTQASGLSNLFGQQPQFLPEQQAFIFSFEQKNELVIARWQISDGYYLYKDKFKLSSNNGKISDITFPKGVMHDDDYYGPQEVFYRQVEITFKVSPNTMQHDITLNYQGCADAGLCYPPNSKVLFYDPKFVQHTAIDSTTPSTNDDYQSEQDHLAGLLQADSLAWTLLLFFGLGIGLAFTPCVFPMYPILSGIIVGAGNKLSTKHAFALSFIYVQGMALTYSALGLVVASLGLQFQALFQHPVVLGSLAILFTVFALSMFGLFNLQLPSKWQEKLNGLANKQQGGRYSSVFIMGMISGLVASPCTTAPLSGALIYVAQTGDLFLGGITLYVLSLGMGVPLLLMGMSGGKLLPKAGAWMEVIKGIFGFMLLSVVIVLLERFVDALWANLAWAALVIMFAAYLSHHNNLTKSSGAKSARHTLLTVLIVVATLFAAKPWLSSNVTSESVNSEESSISFIQIKGLAQLNEQLALAKTDGVPVMLDFYADWCIACKEFEHQTFGDPMIKPILQKMRLIQADVTANDALDIALQEHYSILGLPSILLFNSQGQELRAIRVVGFQKPAQFKTVIEQAFTQYTRYP